MSDATVSLVLPNRNNAPVLDLFFERLAANTTHPVGELIVVDDGSTDRSVAAIERWSESGRLPFPVELMRRPPSGPT